MAPRVKLSISEPWELGEAFGWRPLYGEVLQFTGDLQGGRALIKLDEVLEHGGKCWRYVVVSPRHEGVQIVAIQAGNSVLVACTGVTDSDAESCDEVVPKKWRGGLAFIADMELAR